MIQQEDKEKQQEQNGGNAEDPPTNVTKQNKAGESAEKEKVDVPEKALENYKKSGLSGEE